MHIKDISNAKLSYFRIRLPLDNKRIHKGHDDRIRETRYICNKIFAGNHGNDLFEPVESLFLERGQT